MCAVKYGNIAIGIVALRYQVLDDLNEGACFRHRCVEGIVKDVTSCVFMGSECVLFLSFCVSGDDLLCGTQNFLATPIVVVQSEFCRIIIGFEVVNIRWIRAAPTIDRLIFISDDHEVVFGRRAEELE